MSLDTEDLSTRYLRFNPFSAPVQFDDCADLIAGIRSIFLGWDITESATRGEKSPVIRFRKKSDRFIWHSRHFPPPKGWRKYGRYRRIKETVADFHYVFFDWYTVERPTHFCLHCAAVEMAGKLVIFPNTRRAGKSTLVTEMARRGHRIFCDDVLIIVPETSEGLGLGIMPRLRLPLPDNLSEEQRRFVTDNIGLHGTSTAYLNLDEMTLAAFGATAPIGAVVLLDRQDGLVEAAFHPAGRAETLARLIYQNAPEKLSPTMIFDRLSEIVEAADLRRLYYSDLSDAADLLERAFGD